MNILVKNKKALIKGMVAGIIFTLITGGVILVGISIANRLSESINPYRSCELVKSTDDFTISYTDTVVVEQKETVSEIAEEYIKSNPILLLEYTRKDVEYSIIKINNLDYDGYVTTGTKLLVPVVTILNEKEDSPK